MVIGTRNVFSYSTLLERVEDCIRYAFLDMSDTESGELFRSSYHFVTISNEPRIVQMDDVHLFGRKLAARLQIEINCMTEFSKVYFVVQGLGQSSVAENMIDVLSRFEMENAIEVVVHVAIDIWEEGYGLFWLKNKTVENSGGSLSAEYYPLALGRSGNFYMSMPDDQVPTEPSIRMVRFYNSCLKNVHRVKGAPFKKAGFGLLFWGTVFKPKPYVAATIKEIEDYSTALEVTKNNVDVLKTKRYYRARTEFIISTIMPGNSVVEDVVLLVKQKFLEKELYSPDMFLRLPVTVVVDRVKNYLDPALCTIAKEMEKCLKSVTANVEENPYMISVDHMHTICACEIIVSFFAFGLAVSTRGARRHNNQLCTKLGLVTKNFSTTETRENMFQDNVSYYEDGTMKLFLSDGEIIPELFYIPGEMRGVLKLSELLSRLRKNWDSPDIEKLAMDYVTYCLESGATQKSKMKFNRQQPCQSTSRIVRKKAN